MFWNGFNGARKRAQVLALGAIACAVLMLGACNGVQVRTLTAPGSDLRGRTTFRLMRAPTQRRGGQLETNDPMLVNSITYRRMRAAVRGAFQKRGYQYSDDGAALDVAYYATTRHKLDIRSWDYGYGWRRFPRERTAVSEYEEGTVIIDVVDPATHELLWRGSGRAAVSNDPDKYARDLERVVEEIVEKFPGASR